MFTIEATKPSRLPQIVRLGALLVAGLLLPDISWAQDGVRAEVSRNWIDTNKARYVARIK